uniref:GUN4 domain-containing protein n=1 Tax=Trichocoleus desertorum TaxID=1481672 RepID=UPI0025B5E8C8|nr:GUN4 domain-containing protein [Trichocoleus desertorum]
MQEKKSVSLIQIISRIPKDWQYCLSGLFLVSIGFIITWKIPSLRFFIGIPIFLIGCYLYFSSWINQRLIRQVLSFVKGGSNYNKNINLSGGTYNEFIEGDYVQGDYIKIQGNQIYIGQDLSHFTAQIQEILNQLRTQNYSKEEAEERVVQELKTQGYKNSKLRKRLFKWKKSIGSSTTDIEEIAKKLVQLADEVPANTGNGSIFVTEGKYKRLHDLLEAEQWKEADEETAKIIYDLMPYKDRWHCLEVEEIPPGDLKLINKLWLRYSKGRFGFSVQQRIWKRVSNTYPPEQGSWKNERAYAAFIDCVGWSFEDGRLYYTDLQYSLTAPPGHLPAVAILKTNTFFSYSSNYCYLNQTVFDDLMKRQYERNSFIPSWLRCWFLEE